jgi:alanine racemase
MNSCETGSTLTVDLAAIVDNWRLIASRLSATSRAGAVVKADAYGLGAIAVGRALQAAGCTRFFVASLDEAVSLRGALRPCEILVMNGFFAEAAALYRQHRLIPLLNTVQQAREWQALASGLPAALQTDSGMTRLGISLAEAAMLADDHDFRESVKLMLIVSHLACADDPSHPQNLRQLTNFTRALGLFPGIDASLAASSGVFLGGDYHFDWVRPGAALYGINPTPGQANPLRQVVRLQAKILQLRDIDAGISVGYGATYRSSRPARLATVAIGYADGLFRLLGNRGHGHVGDKLVPLVGRVSMDLATFDVTGHPALREGDFIELIGRHTTPDDLAALTGTIGYEILTSLGPRLHRHYLGATQA